MNKLNLLKTILALLACGTLMVAAACGQPTVDNPTPEAPAPETPSEPSEPDTPPEGEQTNDKPIELPEDKFN